MLVTKDDRPVLEEGEFYTHDLIGMTVVLKVWVSKCLCCANTVN